MSLWRWLAALASRLEAAIRRRQLDRDLDDELAFHLAMKQQRLAADGMADDEAARHAQRRLGNVTRLKEELREMWTFPSLESIGQDLAYAVRGLRQQRGFTATVVIVLACVIGLNTTLFTVLAGVALRPWPGITEPSRVLRLYLADPSGHHAGMSLADARSLHRQATALAGVAMMKNAPVRVGRGEGASASEALHVSGSFFEILGVQMARGRGFVDNEDQPVRRSRWSSSALRTGRVISVAILTSSDRHSRSMTLCSPSSESCRRRSAVRNRHTTRICFCPWQRLRCLKPGDPASQAFLYDTQVCYLEVVVRLAPGARPPRLTLN